MSELGTAGIGDGILAEQDGKRTPSSGGNAGRFTQIAAAPLPLMSGRGAASAAREMESVKLRWKVSVARLTSARPETVPALPMVPSVRI